MIIGKVGRKGAKIKALNTSIHVVLILGAITMIYPFLLMISFSFKSGVDSTSLDLVPKFFYDDSALYQKYMESRYNEESTTLMDNYPGDWLGFFEVSVPKERHKRAYEKWNDFLDANGGLTVYDYYVAEHYGRGIYPYAQRKFRKLMREENNNDLHELSEKYNIGAKSWNEIVIEEKDIYSRHFSSSSEGYIGRFRKFKQSVPYYMRYYVNSDGNFVNRELINYYNNDLDKFNQENGTNYISWEDIHLSVTVPKGERPLRKLWLRYVKNALNVRFVGIKKAVEPEFRLMLEEKYLNIDILNKTWRSSFTSFAEIIIPDTIPDSGAFIEDITYFIQTKAKPEDLYIKSSAEKFREYLLADYQSIELLNSDWKTDYKSFSEINFPVSDIDYFTFIEHKKDIRKEFLWRNYAMALDQMLSDANSLRNTGIYVLLSIIMAITINPMAAYALSRFKPKYSYQIILIFMLTMAFPAMVMGIPNFLMLKKLSLLNTFWALVLPGAADGYFIFLLKGFFDSLPRELYESAQLDGAGEFRLFWQFTLYLSKPILAVIALGAFNAAYRNFMFAFLVCQDQSMWTLMVHIYELMQSSAQGVGYAALVIAAIPTLAVFVFFQNIIIEGIVVPMEK